jgi:protease I
MIYNLVGKRIAILVETGFDQPEYLCLKSALEHSGAEIETVSPSTEVRAWTEVSWGDLTKLDKNVESISSADFDGLVIPGGKLHLEKLKQSLKTLAFVKSFLEEGKPVAAFNEGIALLTSTGEIAGLHLTSTDAYRTELMEAGAHWEDELIVVDHGLVTGRERENLSVFCEKVAHQFATLVPSSALRLPRTLQSQVLH